MSKNAERGMKQKWLKDDFIDNSDKTFLLLHTFENVINCFFFQIKSDNSHLSCYSVSPQVHITDHSTLCSKISLKYTRKSHIKKLLLKLN